MLSSPLPKAPNQEIDSRTATQEFRSLLEDLEAAGLHAEVRAGYEQTLLVFVKAPRELLGNTVYKLRHVRASWIAHPH